MWRNEAQESKWVLKSESLFRQALDSLKWLIPIQSFLSVNPTSRLLEASFYHADLWVALDERGQWVQGRRVNWGREFKGYNLLSTQKEVE
jgi:hypothetical protein